MAVSTAVSSSLHAPRSRQVSESFRDLLSEVKLSPVPARRQIEAPVEIEAKFYVPAGVGEQMKRGRRPSMIDQHILAASSVPKLLERLGITERISNADQLTTARVRRTVEGDGTQSFKLEFKSSRFSDVARWEYPVKITEQLFEKLVEKFSRGAVRKLRYEIPGEISFTGGSKKVTLQLDEVVAAGPKLKALKEPFFTADLEVSNALMIERLRAGKHSFECLSHCVELTAQRTGVSKPISSRTIAREGFGARQIKAVERLEQSFERPKKR